MFKHIFAVDWEQVRFKRALSGLVAILVALAFIGVVETVVLIMVVATLFNIAAANDGPMERRWRAMVQFSIVGAVAGGLAFWSIDNASGAALVLGVVTYLATLIAALGERQGRAGLFLTLWVVIAMVVGTTETAPLIVSIAFIIGGGFAIAITALRLRFTREDPADDETASVGEVDPDDVAPVGSVATRLKWASRTSMGAFAFVRASAVVVATLVGFWLFPDYAFWASITVIIVVKPSASQIASVAMERTLGTALGALVAVMAVQLFPGNQVYAALGFALSAFFMVAFMNANYMLFAAFLTSTLVFALRMGQEDAFDVGIERFAATLAGTVISLGTVGIGRILITHKAGYAQQP
jgi:hypothetical protein